MRVEYFNKESEKLSLHMVNCGYEDCCPDFVCRPHKRKYYLIHYVVKGSGFYEVNGEKYSVSAGEIFIIYPGQIITYYSPDINSTWSFCWIGVNGGDSDAYFSEAGLTPGKYVMECNLDFYKVIMRCLEYVNSSKNFASQLKLNAYILESLEFISEKTSAKKNLPVHHIERAKNFIEYNYMNYISSRDVVKYLNIDRTYFYRLFKQHIGLSPEQYIIKLRIKKACELIETGKYSFSEISDFVGIGDIYYFSKLFKKVKGVTPSEYKTSFTGKISGNSDLTDMKRGI